MHVFVTGASGHIGLALTRELLAAGHQVTGLARSDASADKLKAVGAIARRGTLDDFDLLKDTAQRADGVVHLGYKHELALGGTSDGFQRAAAHDLRVVQVLGGALIGASSKPFVSTSGTALLAHFDHDNGLGLGRAPKRNVGADVEGDLGLAGTEEDVLPSGPRVDSENAVIALSKHGVRSSVIRLAPTVHSSLDHAGFIPMFVAAARRNGVSVYVGDGNNVWPAIHTLDAARLYRLALESAPPGTRLHGVAEEGVPFRAIAEAIGKGLGLPVRSVSVDDAPKYLGGMAHFAQMHNPASSLRTREWLRFQPTHAGLLEDLATRHYFELAAR